MEYPHTPFGAGTATGLGPATRRKELVCISGSHAALPSKLLNTKYTSWMSWPKGKMVKIWYFNQYQPSYNFNLGLQSILHVYVGL